MRLLEGLANKNRKWGKAKSRRSGVHRHAFQCVNKPFVSEENRGYGYELMPCEIKGCKAIFICEIRMFLLAPEEHRQKVIRAVEKKGFRFVRH